MGKNNLEKTSEKLTQEEAFEKGDSVEDIALDIGYVCG